LDIKITQRHDGSNTEFQEFVKEKLTKCAEKYAIKISTIAVVLEKKKVAYVCEVQSHAKNLDIFAAGESDASMYAAVEEALEKVEIQFKRHKDKIKSHKGGKKIVAEDGWDNAEAELYSNETIEEVEG